MGFCAKDYDENGDGFVSWIEFFNVYRQRNIVVRLSLCERIFLTFDDPDSSVFAQILSIVLLSVILISSACFILSTVDEFQDRGEGPEPLLEAPSPTPLLKNIDLICLMLFCVEYLVRLATVWNVRMEVFKKNRLLDLVVGFDPIYLPGPGLRVLRFIFTPANLIDLAAILPAAISLLVSSSGNGGLVVLRIIRLTRIFRAFKSPALIEPVIVIGRTLTQSTKALYVLAFNLLLGIIISGSLMYLAEGQGQWDEAQQRYTRRVGWQWNATSQQMEEVTEVSPFQSIPHTFWWAIVTITTVGYGDLVNHPRTGWGYVVTMITMVFSLVMLALPVGVIGGTFSQVWSEFDEERKREAELVRQELFFVTTSLQRLDPEQMCRMMLVEVWDDHGLLGQAKARSAPFRFMGEAKLELELPCNTRIMRQKTLQLQPNMDLVARKVSGEVTMRYSWTPKGFEDNCQVDEKRFASRPSRDLSQVDVIGLGKMMDPELEGRLEVTIVSANRLINLGNTARQGASNPYCMVFVYPIRPAAGSLLRPCVWQTPTAPRTLSPCWEVSHIFDYNWSAPFAREDMVVSRVESGAEAEMLEAQGLGLGVEKLGEVAQLIRVLAAELQQLKEEVKMIASRLDWLSLAPGSSAALASAASSPPEHCPQSAVAAVSGS